MTENPVISFFSKTCNHKHVKSSHAYKKLYL